MALIKKAQKKQIKATVLQSGGTKKAARKEVNTLIKTANGGITKGGKILRGGLNLAGAIVPGVGGVAAVALLDKIKKPVIATQPIIPTGLTDNPLEGRPMAVDVAEKNKEIGEPMSEAKQAQKPQIASDVPPSLNNPARTPLPVDTSMQEETQTEKEKAADKAAETPNPGVSYQPKTNAKKSNKNLYIGLGILALVIAFFMLKKK